MSNVELAKRGFGPVCNDSALGAEGRNNLFSLSNIMSDGGHDAPWADFRWIRQFGKALVWRLFGLVHEMVGLPRKEAYVSGVS